jgi:hypothetical protein
MQYWLCLNSFAFINMQIYLSKPRTNNIDDVACMLSLRWRFNGTDPTAMKVP